MKLTGKCKEAFFNQTLYTEITFDLIGELFQNALIIDFFDSVGIYISINYDCISEGFELKIYSNNYKVCSGIHERTEASNAAIEKANEIFNNR